MNDADITQINLWFFNESYTQICNLIETLVNKVSWWHLHGREKRVCVSLLHGSWDNDGGRCVRGCSPLGRDTVFFSASHFALILLSAVCEGCRPPRRDRRDTVTSTADTVAASPTVSTCPTSSVLLVNGCTR